MKRSEQEKSAKEKKENERKTKDKTQEIKTLVDLVLDDAARDGITERRKSSFAKSVICDVRAPNAAISEYEGADDGRLLGGFGEGEEILFFAAITYIYRWSSVVYAGIEDRVANLYLELGERV